MGRIGRGVGKIAWAMEMNVIYNDLLDVSTHIDYPAQSLTKQELYERADILTLHVNHQPDNLNYHLIDAAGILPNETHRHPRSTPAAAKSLTPKTSPPRSKPTASPAHASTSTIPNHPAQTTPCSAAPT